MPKAKTPTKPPAAKAKSTQAKPAQAKSTQAKPTQAKSMQAKAAKSVAAAADKPNEQIAPAPAPAKPAKAPPQHPGKPEPSWAKFNQGGHAQKMSKGRPFRHQGR